MHELTITVLLTYLVKLTQIVILLCLELSIWAYDSLANLSSERYFWRRYLQNSIT